MKITTLPIAAATIIATVAVVFALPLIANAQEIDNHTAQEEAAGQALWEKLQAEEISCPDLSEEDFAALGEYFMGLMLGDSHEAMNNQMIQMMGEEGEEQMHATLGKRMSGCEPNAEAEYGMGGMMSMMGMGGGFMGGSSSPMSSGFNSFNNNSMMGYGFGGFFGGFIMLLFWALVIVGIIALVRYLSSGNQRAGTPKSALDILKERYAKGEIDRDEFEAKKKDLL